MKEVRICVFCGKEFETYHKNQCCSRKCKGLLQQRNSRVVKVCPICSKKFETYKKNPRKNCSKKCDVISRTGKRLKPRKLVKCPTCGKTRERIISDTHVYCSITCFNKSESKRKYMRENNPTCKMDKEFLANRLKDNTKDFKNRIKTDEKFRKEHFEKSHELKVFSRRKFLNSEEGRKQSKKTSELMKARWKDPVYAEKTRKKMLKSLCVFPNKFEVEALEYLNSIYENKFKYTGDGTLIVNCRSADAYSEELNTIVLFNGVHWHLDFHGLERTEENKRLRERIESEPFFRNGYNVIFIWEDELDKKIVHNYTSIKDI